MGAIRKARELAVEGGNKFYYANQYSNDANWRAHYRTTAPEIGRKPTGRSRTLSPDSAPVAPLSDDTPPQGA